MAKLQPKYGSEKLKEIAEATVDYYIDSITEKLYDDLLETGNYKETDDNEFYEDFQTVYLNLTKMLLDDAIDSINRQKD
jgi:hypothetical protein